MKKLIVAAFLMPQIAWAQAIAPNNQLRACQVGNTVVPCDTPGSTVTGNSFTVDATPQRRHLTITWIKGDLTKEQCEAAAATIRLMTGSNATVYANCTP